MQGNWTPDDPQYAQHGNPSYQEPEYYYDNSQTVNNPYAQSAGDFSPQPPMVGDVVPVIIITSSDHIIGTTSRHSRSQRAIVL